MPDIPQIDLVVLVPDKQMEATLRSILQRTTSLQIRPLTFEILVHPRRDPGCRVESAALLSVYLSRARFALVLFDREGCGEESITREGLESNVDTRLAAAGWMGRSAVIVLDPELEAWVWSDSPVVDQVIGWAGATPPLRQWLETEGFIAARGSKPSRPKEAFDLALKRARKRRSASIFSELAEKVGLNRCIDPSFLRLKAVLQQWFVAGPPSTNAP